MRSALRSIVWLLALLFWSELAIGQHQFGGKLFEELSNRGVNTTGIDGNKFFEDLSSRGVNSKNPIDGKQLFDELSVRGVDTKGIDGNEFLEALPKAGIWLPDMIHINRPPKTQELPPPKLE